MATPRPIGPPPLVRFLLGNVAAGAAIGWTVALFAVLSDVLGIKALLLDGPDVLAGIALLAFASGASFGLGYLATALLFIESD